MKFDTTKEINDTQITTVVLFTDRNDPENKKLYLFHCIMCGNGVVQYQGFVAQIIPGMAPLTLPVIARCNNSSCKHKYAFKAIV